MPAGLAAGAGAAALPAISFDNGVTTPAAPKVNTDQVEFGRGNQQKVLLAYGRDQN